MKIEIEKKVTQIEIIEVEFPYYYKHNLMSDYGDCVIYGKIEEKLCTTIEESNRNNIEKFVIEKEEYTSIKNSGLSCYFNKEYKSNKEEFEDAKERCLSFLSEC